MSNWNLQSSLWLKKIGIYEQVYSVTFLLCWWTFSCPLGDGRPVSRKEECYLMVPDQKHHHYWNPVLSERELEMYSFRPAADLFWSSLATWFWTCNVENKMYFLERSSERYARIQNFSSGEKIVPWLVKTRQTSNFGVIRQVVVSLQSLTFDMSIFIHFIPLWFLDWKRGQNYTTVLKTHQFWAHIWKYRVTVTVVVLCLVAVNKLWSHK